MKRDCLVTEATNQVVTVKSGGVPIIKVKSKNGHVETIMAINFLRTGCPQVQLVFDNGHETVYGAYKDMKDLTLKLHLPKEKDFWAHGEPKIAKGGCTVVSLLYHPLSK